MCENLSRNVYVAYGFLLTNKELIFEINSGDSEFLLFSYEIIYEMKAN